jgi:hypothetical protein
MPNDYKKEIKNSLRRQAFDKVLSAKMSAANTNSKAVREAIYRGIDLSKSGEDMVDELREALWEEEFNERG